jgi:hypothetical protein
MDQQNHKETTVKTGTFLYAAEVVCDICVVQSQVRYGTGDYEDPPEIANDIEAEAYYVHYGSTTQRGVFSAGSMAFPSLEQAVLGAAEQLGPHSAIQWCEGAPSEA